MDDPYPYFDAMRSRCPVHPVPHPGVIAVTGYDEAFQVYHDSATYSSCNSVGGPFPQVLPVSEDVTDVTEMIIERSRDQWPFSEFMAGSGRWPSVRPNRDAAIDLVATAMAADSATNCQEQLRKWGIPAAAGARYAGRARRHPGGGGRGRPAPRRGMSDTRGRIRARLHPRRRSVR